MLVFCLLMRFKLVSLDLEGVDLMISRGDGGLDCIGGSGCLVGTAWSGVIGIWPVGGACYFVIIMSIFPCLRKLCQ